MDREAAIDNLIKFATGIRVPKRLLMASVDAAKGTAPKKAAKKKAEPKPDAQAE